MENFALIAICIAAGILLRRSGLLPADAHKGINAWIIYLALPSVSLKYLPHIQWTKELILPALGPVLVWVGAWLWVALYKRFSGKVLDKKTEAGLHLTAGLCNTSFVGFPLIMAYFGENRLGIAVICDQVTFMLLSVGGIYLAVKASNHQDVSISLIVEKLLKFPPVWGCIIALTVPHFVDISPVAPLINKLAGTIGPLALFSIGLQLQFNGWRQEIKHLSAIFIYKLLLAPLLVLCLAIAMGIRGSVAQISIFEAAMPTILTSAVIADEYDLNPRLVNLIIGVGILLSFITTFFWWLIIRYL
jgi:predicted permease